MKKNLPKFAIKDMKLLLAKIESSTCEIIKDNYSGTGFICRIKFKSQILICLLTSFNVISDKDSKNNIKLKINENMIELNIIF